jgi:ribosomal protein S18 acetylase RimI-like enzyme
MAVELGPASPSQFPEILEFWKRATEVPSSTDDLDGLQALWQHDPNALIIATDEGRVVGTLIACWDGWRAAFYRLAVDPSHRRHGLGRFLVVAGEHRLRQLGARRLSLFAVAAHDAAAAFWPAMGYHLDTEDVRFVRNLRDSVTG